MGKLKMIDISAKGETFRVAKAEGWIFMKDEVVSQIKEGKVEKGDVITAAKLAGIQAAKQTPALLPLCHPLSYSSIEVKVEEGEKEGRRGLRVEATVKGWGRTGMEMEALTAVAVALLTIYDMCKGIDREMEIGNVVLLEKRGGKSGEYKRV